MRFTIDRSIRIPSDCSKEVPGYFWQGDFLMAAIVPDTTTTSATLEEKKKLQKSFRLTDMIFYTVATLLGLDTLGAVSSQGGQVLSWLVISAITFLVPYALLVSELGTTFPQEGGPYEWCKMAGGRFYAAIALMLYWISNPLWLGGTLSVTAIAAIKNLWLGNPKLLFGGTQVSDAIIEMVIALLFIWGTVYFAILSLRVGKWLCILGTYVKLALLAIFIVLALAFFFSGHAKGEHLTFASILPSGDIGLILSAILPVLIFNWVGFEVQNGATEEMHNPQRDIPRSLLASGIIAVIAYIVPITIILFTLSKGQLSNASGFVQAFQQVAGVLPGPLATIVSIVIGVGVIVALASSGGSWIIGADRSYAIAALDRSAPRFIGYFSERYGTPIAVNIFSGVAATITMGVAILITAFGNGGVTALFQIVLGFTVATTTISYLFIFPAFLILRYKYPNVERPYRAPGGMVGAWIITILTTGYAAIATYFILVPTDSAVSGYGVSRFTYEATEFGALAIIFLLTVVFYVWGHREVHNKDVVVPVAETA